MGVQYIFQLWVGHTFFVPHHEIVDTQLLRSVGNESRIGRHVYLSDMFTCIFVWFQGHHGEGNAGCHAPFGKSRQISPCFRVAGVWFHLHNRIRGC